MLPACLSIKARPAAKEVTHTCTEIPAVFRKVVPANASLVTPAVIVPFMLHKFWVVIQRRST